MSFKINATPKPKLTLQKQHANYSRPVSVYYFNSLNTQSSLDVEQIYNSVIQTLAESGERKFIAVETSYFSRWYNEKDEPTKQRVQALVNSGNQYLTTILHPS